MTMATLKMVELLCPMTWKTLELVVIAKTTIDPSLGTLMTLAKVHILPALPD